MAKVIKGIINAKDVEGNPHYKVRYEGLGKEHDEWVGKDQVTETQIEKFKEMKAKAVACGGGGGGGAAAPALHVAAAVGKRRRVQV